MNHDERHQEECEQQRWYEEGPESETWKQHNRFRKELRERIEDCAEQQKRIWSGRDIS